MNVQIIYFALISILLTGCLGFFIQAILVSVPETRPRFGNGQTIKERLGAGRLIDIGGTYISLLNYQIVRFLALGAWFILIILLKVLKGMPLFGPQLFLLILLAAASTPRKKIGRIKLPISYIDGFFSKVKKDAANKEIYRSLSQLINLFTIKGEGILGSNYVIEELIKNARITKPVYLKMLSMWNMNKKQQAADYFADIIGTKEARALAAIFLKLDNISPQELKLQLLNYQNNIKTEAITAREKINERNGNLIYILAIISAVVVLLNFLVVVLTDVFTSYSLLSF
ncbi:MAG: hypothetical protein FJW69_09880 [Actinobacteria bacterium]|nr:hypothetical protein [Actinomycetota bacterium]